MDENGGEEKNKQASCNSNDIDALSLNDHPAEDIQKPHVTSNLDEKQIDQVDKKDNEDLPGKAIAFETIPAVDIHIKTAADDDKTEEPRTRPERSATDGALTEQKSFSEYKKSSSFDGTPVRVKTNFVESEIVKKYLVHKKKNLANTLKELHITKMNQLYVKDPKTGKMSVTVRRFADIRDSTSDDKAIVVMSDKGERKYIFTNLRDKLEFSSLIKSRKHVTPEKGKHTSVPLELKESELEPNTALYPCEGWREGSVVKHKGKLLITRYRIAVLESGPRTSMRTIKGSKLHSVKGVRHSKAIEIVNRRNISGILCVKALGIELLAIDSIIWERNTLIVHCKDLRVLHFKIFLVASVVLDILKKYLYDKVYPNMSQVANMYTYRKWFETKKVFCEKNYSKDIKLAEVLLHPMNASGRDALARELSDVASVIYTTHSTQNKISDEEKILKAEFLRVTRGLLKKSRSGITNLFRVSDVNKDYTLCSTYPRYLVVPKLASNDLLKKVALHRSKERIPIVVWVSEKDNGVHISRCAQPSVGLLDTGFESDVEYVDLLRRCNISCSSPQLVIVDCRPKVNANVNKLKGKGFENIARYKECFFQFFDIHNIHKMRDSLFAVKKMLLHPQDDDWYAKLDHTSWIIYMRSILSCASQVVNIITQKKSVMIHCSDGWDRTSQVSALSQLLLDSYYRSCKGFLILVRKEWMWFGHMISTRNGNFGISGVPTTKRDQRSPIFIQWLECVFQFLRKFPSSFEFTEQFLLDIAKCFNSGEFGDFFFNCEKERMEHTSKLAIPRSMHKWFEKRLAIPNNPYINPTSQWRRSDVLHHQFIVRDLVLWERLHCPFDHNDIEVDTFDVLYRKSLTSNRFRPPAPPRDVKIRKANSERFAKLPKFAEGDPQLTKEWLERKIESLRSELQMYDERLQSVTKPINHQVDLNSVVCLSDGKSEQNKSADEMKSNYDGTTAYV